MSYTTTLLVSLLLLVSCCFGIVPMPQTITTGATVVGVSNSFQFTATTSSPDLVSAFQRYKELIFIHPISQMQKSYLATISQLTVTVKNINVPLQLGADESYTLDIPADGSSATLSANTVYGAYHGLETFSQLVVFSFNMHSYQVSGAPVHVVDTPRFTHRGLLIDTSRHFEPIQTIEKVIASLTYAKLNVLHWHMVDTQSFPLESKKYPNLWNGAYSNGEQYTQDDVSYIVEYARQRGVRVMVEFDMPGHAASWCAGYPNICPSASCTQPLNPATNETFDLIQGLLGEITGMKMGGGLFPENLLHLGGDEVDTTCWTRSTQISQWMQRQGLTADQTYMYFVKRAQDIALAQGRSPVNWEEVFNHFGNKLDNRTVIHVWLDHATLGKVVAAGYRGILSNQDVWYLDHLATTWQQFYLNDPLSGITDRAQQARVLGGEVCMWGETVDTSDMFNTVWPRAAAAAERLWSAATSNNTNEFHARLEAFRCLLNNREIEAAPTNNANARAGPPGPGSCLAQ